MQTSTRTHTHYWGDDQLDELRRARRELALDAIERMRHVSAEVQQAMCRRLDALDGAIEFMAERAD